MHTMDLVSTVKHWWAPTAKGIGLSAIPASSIFGLEISDIITMDIISKTAAYTLSGVLIPTGAKFFEAKRRFDQSELIDRDNINIKIFKDVLNDLEQYYPQPKTKFQKIRKKVWQESKKLNKPAFMVSIPASLYLFVDVLKANGLTQEEMIYSAVGVVSISSTVGLTGQVFGRLTYPGFISSVWLGLKSLFTSNERQIKDTKKYFENTNSVRALLELSKLYLKEGDLENSILNLVDFSKSNLFDSGGISLIYELGNGIKQIEQDEITGYVQTLIYLNSVGADSSRVTNKMLESEKPELSLLAAKYFEGIGNKNQEENAWKNLAHKLRNSDYEEENFGEGAVSRVFSFKAPGIENLIVAKEDLIQSLQYQEGRVEEQNKFLQSVASQPRFLTIIQDENLDEDKGIAFMDRINDPIFYDVLREDGISPKTIAMYEHAARVTAILNANLTPEVSQKYKTTGPIDYNLKIREVTDHLAKCYGIQTLSNQDIELLVNQMEPIPNSVLIDAHSGNFAIDRDLRSSTLLDPEDNGYGKTDTAKLLTFGDFLDLEEQMRLLHSTYIQVYNSESAYKLPGVITDAQIAANVAQQLSFISAWIKNGKEFAINRIPGNINQGIMASKVLPVNIRKNYTDFFEQLQSLS